MRLIHERYVAKASTFEALWNRRKWRSKFVWLYRMYLWLVNVKKEANDRWRCLGTRRRWRYCSSFFVYATIIHVCVWFNYYILCVIFIYNFIKNWRVRHRVFHFPLEKPCTSTCLLRHILVVQKQNEWIHSKPQQYGTRWNAVFAADAVICLRNSKYNVCSKKHVLTSIWCETGNYAPLHNMNVWLCVIFQCSWV